MHIKVSSALMASNASRSGALAFATRVRASVPLTVPRKKKKNKKKQCFNSTAHTHSTPSFNHFLGAGFIFPGGCLSGGCISCGVVYATFNHHSSKHHMYGQGLPLGGNAGLVCHSAPGRPWLSATTAGKGKQSLNPHGGPFLLRDFVCLAAQGPPFPIPGCTFWVRL